MSSPVPLRPWRFEELPDRDDLLEGYRYEVVDGNLIVSPPPAHRHQKAVSLLLQQLAAAAPPAWFVVTDFGLRLPEHDGRIPDLAVIRDDAGTGPWPYPYGPDAFGLVVEVTSPSSRKTDLFAKPGEYAGIGIPIFWRFDLDPEPCLHAFVLREASYDENAMVTSRGLAPVPWGEVMVDVSAF